MSVSTTKITAVHLECVRNRSSDFNLHVTDGCTFYAPGDDLACAACGCHQSYHRRVAVDLPAPVVIDNRLARSKRSRNTFTARAASPEPEIPATNRIQLSPDSSATRDVADVPPVGPSAGPVQRRKRISTQKIAMLKEVVERKEWKMFRHYSSEEVEEICSAIGIERDTLKDWIYKLRHKVRENNRAAHH